MKFKDSDIKRITLELKERVELAVFRRLQMIGEDFITNARNNANFTDRTGNLRSSIGYVILKNGLQLFGSNWVQIRQGKEGIVAGERLLKEMAEKYPTGLILVCVAGMSYAAAVESKGFDVISNSSTIAEQKFRTAIEKINEGIQNQISEL